MAAPALREYHRKRNFTRTREPRGTPRRSGGSLFVVHKHAARRLHYDLRLELDGVLKSWAVTRGPSLSPDDKRLAVRVEDHPLSYAEFEGRIPEGEYGAGSVIVWDRGRWSTEGDPHQQLAKGHLTFELQGSKLKGRWHLVHMKARERADKENWLLIKADDEFAQRSAKSSLLEASPRSVKTGRTVEDVASSKVRVRRKARAAPYKKDNPGTAAATADVGVRAGQIRGARRQPLPAFIEPALATLVDAPPMGDQWVHEVKFDGYRLIARIDRGRVRLKTRSGLDWTDKFPSVQKALQALPADAALIDGEVVVETEAGVPDFASLQADLSEGRSDRFRYYMFDLLHLDGWDLTGAALLDRKGALAHLMRGRSGDVLRCSEHFTGRGDVVLKHACRLGLEGIVSKLGTAPYRTGRSKAWLKSKCTDSQELVVVGYVPSTTQRRAIGSLALGYYDKGTLIYAGRVGSGFSSTVAEQLWQKLDGLRVAEPALVTPPPAEARRNVRWTKPNLVAEIEFRGWTADNIVRHAVFKGLRQDKRAPEIVREATAMTKAPSDAGHSSKALAVALTHPDRVLWPDAGVTKQGLAEFYAQIWPWIAPWVIGRPLALLRCPGGIESGCFFQKHAWAGIADSIIRAKDPEDGEELLAIRDVEGLLALTQASVLEIHVWGATLDNIEKPDGITFDLDPAPEVAWDELVDAAAEVRDRLKARGLDSFVKTTGGKGLHVYAPLKPHADWSAVKTFAHDLARAMAKDSPRKFLATASKVQRRGRIFIDYLRNGRGATAVAPYSTRARSGATVSTPLAWSELGPEMRPDRFTVANLLHRLSRVDDPWQDVRKKARRLPS
ncbi:MAG: DNA ligase D [Hyphomicrobiaceae bacterium]|nr:MAG: DNA ligase D [Hyphomicrobiaceae bacterium]